MRLCRTKLLLSVLVVLLLSATLVAKPASAEIRYYSSVPIMLLRGGQDAVPYATPVPTATTIPQVTPTPTLAPTVTPPPTPSQDPVLVSPALAELVTLLADYPDQGRNEVILDPILVDVAAARAADMADRDYFGHTDPDGYGPNYHAIQAGFPLPGWYSAGDDANNIESIAAGQWTVQDVFAGWLASPAHRAHLLGETSFFAGQTYVGVGYAEDSNSTYGRYWVFISAHSD